MVSSISAEIIARRHAKPAAGVDTAFLVFDTESVPDGRLLNKIKYPDDNLSPEEAIRRAQEEAREQSPGGSDFLPVTFQIPVAVCVLRVGPDFSLQAVACLDAPRYRTEEMVRQFWRGVEHYSRAKLVTFNGRGFDLPLMELAAFDHGCSARDYFQGSRNRFHGNHLDLLEFLSNYGAFRLVGGLNLMAQRGPGPRGAGKMDVSGDQVYRMHGEGRLREINDYCLFDTLDTYFVFLRTRVMIGEITLDIERRLVQRARDWLTKKAGDMPALLQYLDNWHPE